MQHAQGPVVRTGAAPDPARGGRRGLRQHHALAAHAHIAPALRRLHRVPGQGPGHVPVGPRRARPVRAAARQHEAGVQGQEETHVPRQRALRVTRARRGDAVPEMMAPAGTPHNPTGRPSVRPSVRSSIRPSVRRRRQPARSRHHATNRGTALSTHKQVGKKSSVKLPRNNNNNKNKTL